jgi:5-methylcytosine-specific restriction endonuclease McrA
VLLLLLLLLLASPAAAAEASCPVNLTLQNDELTPGATRKLSKKTICSTRWGIDKRYVTQRMKQGVYESYGLSGPKDKCCVPDKHGRRCEIDHLVPRSLGGADEVENLWPQPYGSQPWNATRKDRLEVRVSKEYCKGNISLEVARGMMTGDYRIAYRHYFGEPQEKANEQRRPRRPHSRRGKSSRAR